MKKILILLLVILLSGCTFSNLDNDFEIDKILVDEIEIDKYVDDNPIKLGFYKYNKLVTEYNAKPSNFKDFAVFDIFYTNIYQLDNISQRDNYMKYYNEYKNISEYKVGFYLSFYVGEEFHEGLILKPSDMHKLTPYIYVYLYDDINQIPGKVYSHLEGDSISDGTIISSIKLFFAQEGSKVTGPIDLMVFTYDGDDDFNNEMSYYRGRSFYKVRIEI